MFSSQKGADEVGPINRYIRDRMEPHETGTPLEEQREKHKRRGREKQEGQAR